MDIYQILLSILDKPNTPKVYKELYNHYQNNGKFQEAIAINHLIESKFKEKDDPIDDSNVGKKQ